MPAKKRSQSGRLQAPPPSKYRGRFAPSPTGPLHFGSLIAAVASYLQAKSSQGDWLVRMEDLDPPREVPGSADDILRTLEQHGLHWDESVLYQSQRHDAYLAAIHTLSQHNLTYHCNCSRKDISKQQHSHGIFVYPGTCRDANREQVDQCSIRIKTESLEIGFDDNIQGYFSHNVGTYVGDFVLQRADGWFAYQLAVVIDDAEQEITEIVRGSDLLDNTSRQIFLQRVFGFEQPKYAHLPVATNASGEKLSKQTFAQPVSNTSPSANIMKTLEFLGQNPPAELASCELDNIWQWALEHWQMRMVPKVLKIPLDT